MDDQIIEVVGRVRPPKAARTDARQREVPTHRAMRREAILRVLAAAYERDARGHDGSEGHGLAG